MLFGYKGGKTVNNTKSETVEIAFVVLHYMLKEITIKCVETIKERIDTLSYKIIVVDNASTNNTGQELKKLYSDDENVKVLVNKQNLGFAKGNNVGFLYAKQHLNPDYIILMNNDVFIQSYDIMKKLNEEYSKSKFAVLGPLIMTKDGKCDVNPISVSLKTKNDVLNKIKGLKRIRFMNKIHLLPLYNCLGKIKRIILGKRENKKKDFLCKQYDVYLHGCFWAFSKEYIKIFDGLDDRTFMYSEEYILYKHVIENGLHTVYLPDVIVYHEEEASADYVTKKERKKIEFAYKNMIESTKILLDIFEYYEKNKGV